MNAFSVDKSMMMLYMVERCMGYDPMTDAMYELREYCE